MHRAHATVASLNSGPATPPTLVDVMMWEERGVADVPPWLPMAFGAWWRVHKWLGATDADNAWDELTAEAMAELSSR
jgi:hypothetical protein